MQALIHTARVDLLNNIRKPSFMMVILAMSVLAMLFLPQSDASYKTIDVDGYRGVYDSAWIGDTLAILNVCFLPYILFYYLRGSIQNDTSSLRLPIFAVSKLNKVEYVTGKYLSNLLLSLMLLICMCVIALFMQLWIGESRSIDLVQLLLPQLVHVVPLLVLLCAVCALFDCVPMLQGSVGNIGYFLVVSFFIFAYGFEVFGIDAIKQQIEIAVTEISGSTSNEMSVGLISKDENEVIQQFVWQGASYSSALLYNLALVAAISVSLLVLSVMVFSFNRQLKRATPERSAPAALNWLWLPIRKIDTTFAKLCSKSRFLTMLHHEISLLTRGMSIYLYLGLAALWLIQAFVSLEILRTAILPLSVLLSGIVLSSLGQRESASRMGDLIANASMLNRLQFPAMYIAALLFLTLCCLPTVARYVLSGEWYALFVLGTGFAFTVGLAILLGILTKTPRTFEIVFVLIWYMGPISKLNVFDFVGVDIAQNQLIHSPIWFGALAAVLLVLSVVFRKSALR